MLARVTQAEQLVAQAAQWQAAGRADMAAQLYGAALEQDPGKFAIRMQLAECLVALGQAEPAAEQYLMVAQAYAARGRHNECLAICERVLSTAPHAFVYMSVGPMVRRIGRQARPVCARAAEAHLVAGRQTDGLQMLRLGAELDPHNAEVRRQLARIYQARHMKREAVEVLCDAGNLLLQAKRFEDYVQVAEQILTLEPRDIETLRDLPRVYLELRKPQEAVRALGRLTKVSPGDISGYETLAQAFALIGRIDKALSVLERLVEELGATGQADKADAILNHARYWRPTDLGFLRSLKRMEVPRPKPQARADSGPREAAPEGTVVLSIADLLVDENKRRGATAGQAPSEGGVRLTEAEGTLTLSIDELILDEMEQASGHGVAPTKPPLGSPPPPPGPAARPAPPAPRGRPAQRSSDATMSLDASDLLEALTGQMPQPDGEPRDQPIEATSVLQDDMRAQWANPAPDDAAGPATVMLTAPKDVDEDTPTRAPPGRAPVKSPSISELIYDDEEAEEEPDDETLLHMKPLTAADIERAMAKQAAAAAPQPAAPPPAAPPPAAPPPRTAMPDPVAPSPVMPRPGPATPGPMMGDEAPTMARLTPLTAADIARALSRGTPTRPPPGRVNEDAATLPPPSRGRSAHSDEPEEPPLLPPMLPLAGAPPREEEEELTTTMEALRPEDLLRGPGGGPRGSGRR